MLAKPSIQTLHYGDAAHILLEEKEAIRSGAVLQTVGMAT